MAFIGNQPAESFTSFATQEFSTSATTSYTLDHAVTNENEIALFVNNVRQQPGSGKAYTATGTTLTLSAATASTDTMYCVFLGRALQTVTPATNSITADMVSNDLISGKDALTSAPADTDEFLISDAGVLKRIDASLVVGGGKVSQVVYGSTNTQASSNSSSFADTGLTATITPSASSSKVLVIVNQNGLYKTGADIRMQGKLLRGSTNLGNFIGDETLRTSSSDAFDMGGTGFSYLDSPSTTSSTVYKTQFRNVDNTNTIEVQNGSSVSSITLLEILA